MVSDACTMDIVDVMLDTSFEVFDILINCDASAKGWAFVAYRKTSENKVARHIKYGPPQMDISRNPVASEMNGVLQTLTYLFSANTTMMMSTDDVRKPTSILVRNDCTSVVNYLNKEFSFKNAALNDIGNQIIDLCKQNKATFNVTFEWITRNNFSFQVADRFSRISVVGRELYGVYTVSDRRMHLWRMLT